MRNWLIYLFVAAIIVRAVAYNYYDEPVRTSVYVLLAGYVLLLVLEGFVPPRLRWFPYVYLFLQADLIVLMMLASPKMDFLPDLFYPLSYYAVNTLGRRVGFIWVSAFILAMVYPVMWGWEWQAPGLAIVILTAATCFLVGSYAALFKKTSTTIETNGRLLAELQDAHRQLQDKAGQVEELAIAGERSRMARELHDSVTQTIFSMNLAAQSAGILLDSDPARVTGQLDRLQELARGAAGEIQALVEQLRPRSLVEEGLPQALSRLVDERGKREGLQIDLSVKGDRSLPEPVTLGLLRIAQEALNNVAKHAGTRRACLRLDLEARPAVLEVADDGRGFDPRKPPSETGHFGLTGMAARAGELGWTLSIDSRPGQGTRIRVEEGVA